MRITPKHLISDKFLIGIDTSRLRTIATGKDDFGCPVRVYILSADCALVEEFVRADIIKFYRADYEDALGYIAGKCHSLRYS